MKSYEPRGIPLFFFLFVNPLSLNDRSAGIENMGSLIIAPPSKIQPKTQSLWPGQLEALLDVRLVPFASRSQI
jgi:hypothetical protein